MDSQVAARIRANPNFVTLVQTRSTLAWTLTILMLIVYYAFIFLVAFAPGFMAIPVFGPVTLGFPIGLGIILLAILLTGIYVFRANGEFDTLTRKVTATSAAAEAGR